MADVLHNPMILPDSLPAPQDDGGARHLTGAALPDIDPVALGNVGTSP